MSVDIVQRLLVDYFGFQLYSVMNITDIDDKILKRAKELNSDAKAIARHWEKDFYSDMSLLNIRFSFRAICALPARR